MQSSSPAKQDGWEPCSHDVSKLPQAVLVMPGTPKVLAIHAAGDAMRIKHVATFKLFLALAMDALFLREYPRILACLSACPLVTTIPNSLIPRATTEYVLRSAICLTFVHRKRA